MGVWSHLPLHTVVLQEQLCLSGKRFISAGILSPTVAKSGCLGKEQKNQSTPVFLILHHHIQWVSFPLSWSVCHPWGCSFLLWAAEAKYSQAAMSVWCHPLLQRGGSAALPACFAKYNWFHIWKCNLLVVFTQRLFQSFFILLHSQNGKSYKCHSCFRDMVCTSVLWHRWPTLL